MAGFPTNANGLTSDRSQKKKAERSSSRGICYRKAKAFLFMPAVYIPSDFYLLPMLNERSVSSRVFALCLRGLTEPNITSFRKSAPGIGVRSWYILVGPGASGGWCMAKKLGKSLIFEDVITCWPITWTNTWCHIRVGSYTQRSMILVHLRAPKNIIDLV